MTPLVRVRQALPAALFSLLLLTSIHAALAGPPLPVAPGDLLGSTGAIGGNLISIDPMTGTGMGRFGLGAFGPVTEIVYRADGTLFGD